MAPATFSAPGWEHKAPRDANTPFRLPRLLGGSDPALSVNGAESVASYQYRDYITPTPELLNYRMYVFFVRILVSGL